MIDAQTEPWGIKVTTVEIKDVEIPERMQHAIARQAEAERERRAKIINAEGEFQAAAKLAQAADVIGRNPTTLQLRYLQTLREIGGSQNSTIVFPMPIDLMQSVRDALKQPGTSSAADAEAEDADASELEPVDAPELEPVDAPELEAADAPELNGAEPRELGAGAAEDVASTSLDPEAVERTDPS